MLTWKKCFQAKTLASQQAQRTIDEAAKAFEDLKINSELEKASYAEALKSKMDDTTAKWMVEKEADLASNSKAWMSQQQTGLQAKFDSEVAQFKAGYVSQGAAASASLTSGAHGTPSVMPSPPALPVASGSAETFQPAGPVSAVGLDGFSGGLTNPATTSAPADAPRSVRSATPVGSPRPPRPLSPGLNTVKENQPFSMTELFEGLGKLLEKGQQRTDNQMADINKSIQGLSATRAGSVASAGSFSRRQGALASAGLGGATQLQEPGGAANLQGLGQMFHPSTWRLDDWRPWCFVLPSYDGSNTVSAHPCRGTAY